MTKENLDSIFEDFYEKHVLYMRRFLLSRFNFGNDDIEDYLQEVFLHIYENLQSFNGASSLKTWASEVALNCCRNKFRNKKATKRDYRKNVYMDAADEALNLPSSDKDALQKIIEEEEKEIIKQQFPKIAKEYADTLDLVLSGFNLLDVANKMKTKYKTICGRMSKSVPLVKSLVDKRYKYKRLEGWQSG